VSNLPQDYRLSLEDGELVLYQPNGHPLGTFSLQEEMRHIVRTAHQHENRVNAQIAHLGSLLGRVS